VYALSVSVAHGKEAFFTQQTGSTFQVSFKTQLRPLTVNRIDLS